MIVIIVIKIVASKNGGWSFSPCTPTANFVAKEVNQECPLTQSKATFLWMLRWSWFGRSVRQTVEVHSPVKNLLINVMPRGQGVSGLG